jgi:CYTH domain-containing protein/predicted ATPase
MKQIKSIVYTGGPCGGKTTALSYVPDKLQDYGIKAFVVPEVASDLINSGFHPSNGISPKEFQRQIMKHIIERENRWKDLATFMPGDNKVLLCDRGIMDGMAYVDRGVFQSILEDERYSIPEIRDQRYEAVIHLKTAADGAEEFYNLSNKARKETPEQARALDRATMEAWIGHPKIKVIDNSTNFDQKMKRTLQATCRILGIPVPLEIENKYRIKVIKPDEIQVPYQIVEIEQHYLKPKRDDKGEVRIRKRGQDGYFVYYLTRKEDVRHGVRIETERFISKKEFHFMLSMRDPMYKPLVKKRICFIWENQYFELDIIPGPVIPWYLLEIELTEEHDKVTIPPFIKVVQDVTGMREYSNKWLARVIN